MPQRAMPPERQVQHQTATQPVREAWLQTERQALAKAQLTVSPLAQPRQVPHQMAMEEPEMPLRRVNQPEQVSRQRKERRCRRVKRGPAQASEPQRP